MAIDKNTVMKEAQKFVAKGQFDKAIAEWKKLLKESPNDANIFNTIGDLCLKKDAKADACDAYKRAADILASDGFTSKAIALYKKVINIDPKKIDVHLALGDLNAEKGLSGNALESYKIVADHYMQQKDTVKVLGIYQKMADLNASNVSFRIKLGDMYAKENMIAEASAAYLNAADVHMAKNAFKDARQLFEKVLSLDPGNKIVYHKAGIVYFQEGKFGEACKALKPAFENDPSNGEIADLYLDALSKAGKEPEAEQVIRKILDSDAARTGLREKLAALYLAKNEHNKALDEMTVIAEALAAAGDTSGAENVFKKFVADAPEYVPGRKKLGEFYRSVNREQDAATTFLQAAEILLETGDQGGAKTFLARALELKPDLREAREHLDRLEAAAAVPPPPEPAPEAVKPARTQPAAAKEQPASKPAVAALSILEENPAINEAFTEIDVLVKYGLAAKALEQLEALAVKYPESPQVRMRLQDLYRGQGNASKAVEHALALADIYSSKSMSEQADSVLQTALSNYPTNAALLTRLGRPVPSEALPPETGAVPLQEPSFETSETAEPYPFEATPPEVLSPKPPPAFETAPQFPEPAPTDEITFEGLDAGMPPLEDKEPYAEGPLQTAMPAGDANEQPFTEEAPTPVEEADAFAEAAGAAATGQEFVGEVREPEHAVQPEAEDHVDLGEIWAEAEFYFQQGLFDEAKKHYARIVELNPSERRAIERLGEISREEEQTLEFSKLAEAVEDLGGPAPGAAGDGQELPLSASDEDAVRSLMQEISQLKKPEKQAAPFPLAEEEAIFPPPRISAPKAGPAVDTPAAASRSGAGFDDNEEDFFDLGEELNKESKAPPARQFAQSSDDFFDLAAELRDELSTVAVPERSAGPTEEQSLDEIFEDFKRGVEQQSVKEDVDTHYNLGVAYKEMGLLDDAISEFIMTPEEEPKYILSRYMLGLCYMEKGDYQNAADEIQNALRNAESLSEEEQDTLGMHYDLGLAYQGAGKLNNAISEFQIVHALDPEYRDTATKLKELQQGDFISLDQLKNDIEREISSKFLEAGEKIEREEKNRKNERVRN
jgi:tetratricopeptide (TPR) repeat protein